MNNDAITNNGAELEAALATWCDLIDRGVTVDRKAFLEQYPAEMQEDLSQCLAAFDFIHAAAPNAQRQRIPSDQPQRDREQPPGGLPFRLGDYEVLEEIGRGGMGIVYRATQVSLNRTVAVKILPFAALLDGRQLDRFRNEARAAAMLKHPHIVSVLSVGYEGGLHFYAMELVDGCSLAEVIRATQRPTGERSSADETTPIALLSTEHSADRMAFFRSVARLGIQTANALNVAHEAGIVHRDIKPSNLLLDRDGQLLIADFGLARVQSDKSVTMTGDVVGTLRYMSPEQLQETYTVDHRADIYSLGVTLRELLTGQPTFGSSVRAAVITDIVNGDVPKLRRLVEDVPRDLETVISKAMATQVDARYPNAKGLEQDLIRFLEGRPVLARRAGTLEILGRWCNRNRSKAALIGLLLTLLFAAAIGGPFAAWMQKQRADAQAAITARQRHEAYDADMSRAHELTGFGEINDALKILRTWVPNNGEPDYRKFEWFELLGRCRRRIDSDEIDMNWPVWSTAFSRKGDFAATSYFLGLRVFDDNLDVKWEQQRINGKVFNDCCYGPNGDVLITADGGGLVVVWDAETGERLADVQLEKQVLSLAVSKQGMVAIGLGFPELTLGFPVKVPNEILLSELSVRNQDKITAELKLLEGAIVGATGAIHGVDFSPDGNLLAASSEDGIARVWNVDSRRLVREFTGHAGPVMDVAFSPDGERVCSVGRIHDGTLRSGEAVVWDVNTGKTVQTIRESQAIYRVAYLDDNRFVTGGLDRRLRIWNEQSGLDVDEFNAHADLVRSIAVSADGRKIASGSEDNTVRVWKSASIADVARARVTDSGIADMKRLSFSPDGTLVATASNDGYVRIWDAQNGRLQRRFQQPVEHLCDVAFSPDGSQIVTAAAPAGVFGSNNLEEVRRGSLRLWDVDSETILQTADRNVVHVKYSANGKQLVLICEKASGPELVEWDVASWRPVKSVSVQAPSVMQLDISDDRICTAAGVWKYPSLEPVYTRAPEDGFGFASALSPDGKTLAVSNSQTQTIDLRSLPSGELIQSLEGISEIVMHLDFSPDGSRLVSSTQRGTVVIWNVETGNEVVRYRDHKFWCFCARWSPNGQTLASCSMGRFAEPSVYFRRSVSMAEADRILRKGR